MRTLASRTLVALTVAAALTLNLAACGQKSEPELIASAKAHLDAGDRQTAVIELKAALQQNAGSGEARVLLGNALLQGGAPAQALVEFEKALELKYRDAAVLPPLAQSLLATGNAKAVIERFADATLDDKAAAADLQASVALAYGALGDRARSTATVDAALALDPKNSTARLQKARLTGLRYQADAALAQVDALLADEPRNTAALQLKADLLLGAKGDVTDATKVYRDALAIDPRFLLAHLALISLAQRQNDHAEFRSRVEALGKAAPNSLAAHFFRAEIALADGDVKAAREGVQQLLRVAPTNPQFLQLAGAVELRNGSLAVAESHLVKAMQGAPESSQIRRLLAQTYLNMNDSAKALQTLAPLLGQAAPDAATLTLAAQAQLRSGNRPAADTLFARALKADPNEPSLQSALALSRIAKGDVDAGFARLESAAAHDRGVVADIALINARLRRNELDSALQAVERLQAKLPDQVLPHYLRGRIQLQKGDAAGARPYFEKALALDPKHFASASSLASIDLADGKREAALRRFEALLKLDPGNAQAVIAVADLRQRVGAKPEEIATLLADAVERNPADTSLRLRLIGQRMSQRDTKAALIAAQEAAAAMPNNAAILDTLGEVQLAAGQNEQALVSFGKLVTMQPRSTEPLLRLASAYARAGNSSEAARTLRRALELQPQLLAAQRGLVQLALAGGRFDDAVAVAREVQKQRPESAVGFGLESEARAAQKRWDAALDAARAAYGRDKSGGNAARVVLLYHYSGQAAEAERFAADYERHKPDDADFQNELATLALARSRLDEAEARWRRVLTLRPNDALATNNLAWVRMRQDKPDALALAQRAHELQPESPTIMDTLASAYAAGKQWAQAVQWERKALEKQPGATAYRLKLARWLAASGDKAAARSELDTLSRLGKSFPQQDEVDKLLKAL